ncbi:hypothetical protein PMAYCL1PPCAC_10508, partial [Pristionchus mayeri]
LRHEMQLTHAPAFVPLRPPPAGLLGYQCREVRCCRAYGDATWPQCVQNRPVDRRRDGALNDGTGGADELERPAARATIVQSRIEEKLHRLANQVISIRERTGNRQSSQTFSLG